MKVNTREPPDNGGSSRGESSGPSLPGPQAVAVLASLQESREAWPTGGVTPGEGEATVASAADMMQVDGETSWTGEEEQEDRPEQESGMAWTEVVKSGRREKKKAEVQNVRRRVGMKCSKDRRGILGAEQGAVGGRPEVTPGRREFALRHPKLMISSINLSKDGKTGQRPRVEDHVNIMRQAGLNLDEVRGKVGKSGYLEVALEPGSTSAVGALREVSKKVDSRYTI